MPRIPSNRPQSKTRAPAKERMQTTSLHLPSDLLYILRMVAVSRANRRGGRPSVSDVVREFLQLHRRQFEVEASGPSNRGVKLDAVSRTLRTRPCRSGAND